MGINGNTQSVMDPQRVNALTNLDLLQSLKIKLGSRAAAFVKKLDFRQLPSSCGSIIQVILSVDGREPKKIPQMYRPSYGVFKSLFL